MKKKKKQIKKSFCARTIEYEIELGFQSSNGHMHSLPLYNYWNMYILLKRLQQQKNQIMNGKYFRVGFEKIFAFVLRTGIARRSHLYFVIKSQDHWILRAFLNMPLHYLKIEVTKYIFSLLRIFKVAQQNQRSCDLITEYNNL